MPPRPRRAREHWPQQRVELTLRVDGKPEPERRHRSRLSADGTSVQTYSDPTSAAWREVATWHLRQQMARLMPGPPRPLCGPAKVVVVVWRQRPASTPAAITRCATKPDGDNYAKAAQDALVDAQILYDDGQVDDLRVVKRFADAENPPGVDIVVIADPPERVPS